MKATPVPQLWEPPYQPGEWLFDGAQAELVYGWADGGSWKNGPINHIPGRLETHLWDMLPRAYIHEGRDFANPTQLVRYKLYTSRLAALVALKKAMGG